MDVNKIGELTVRFEKDRYRKNLECQIQTSEEASDMTALYYKMGLTKADMDEHRGYVKGLKVALEMLERFGYGEWEE